MRAGVRFPSKGRAERIRLCAGCFEGAELRQGVFSATCSALIILFALPLLETLPRRAQHLREDPRLLLSRLIFRRRKPTASQRSCRSELDGDYGWCLGLDTNLEG